MAIGFEELQDLILADACDIYSETVIDHAMAPRNLGVMKYADGSARVTGPCGDTMEMRLKVSTDVIAGATFMTDGCGSSIASGSIVTEMAKGKSIGEAQKITQRDMLRALGELPDESRHCALLATDTLKAAIRDYIAKKREPWKRAYRKY
jgi:nitrogen fixation NifU-like protein